MGESLRCIPLRDSIKLKNNRRWICFKTAFPIKIDVILVVKSDANKTLADVKRAAETGSYMLLLDGESFVKDCPPMYFDYSKSSLSRKPRRRPDHEDFFFA